MQVYNVIAVSHSGKVRQNRNDQDQLDVWLYSEREREFIAQRTVGIGTSQAGD